MSLFNHMQSILPRLLESCPIGGIGEEVAAKCRYDEASYTLHKRQQAEAPEKHITLEKNFGEGRRSTGRNFAPLAPSHYLLLSTSQAVATSQAQKSWWPYSAQPTRQGFAALPQQKLCFPKAWQDTIRKALASLPMRNSRNNMGGTGRVNTRERVSSTIEATPGLLWIDIVQHSATAININQMRRLFRVFTSFFTSLGLVSSFHSAAKILTARSM